jgi:hypothetical protein
MGTKQEQPVGIGVGELLLLEASVLRALCMTVNTSGSDMKSKILDTVAEDDFYFPVNKEIFIALKDMMRKGAHVVYTNLEEELHKRSVHVPEDFFIQDLFRGDLPRSQDLALWMSRMKERASKGRSPVSMSRPENQLTPSPAVEPLPVAPALADGPAPAGPRDGDAAPAEREAPAPSVPASGETRRQAMEAEKAPRPRPAKTAGPAKPRKDVSALLTSEGEEWTTYLEEVRSKQGKSFETGFLGLDERAGGLTTGVMLLVDTDRDRMSAFLKQFTDQVAVRSKVPCLFLSYHLPKAAMRVRTLARLSAVAARDIEKGRLKKGSPELESVEKNGREAAEWLKSIFVVDGDPEIDLGAIKDMIQTLRAPSAAGTCLVVVDSLERLAERGDAPSALLAGLKELASTQDVLVVVGTANRNLSSEPGLDFLASLSSGLGNASQLEVLPAGEARATVIRFEYLPEICRFTEQPAA